MCINTFGTTVNRGTTRICRSAASYIFNADMRTGFYSPAGSPSVLHIRCSQAVPANPPVSEKHIILLSRLKAVVILISLYT